MLTSDMDNAKLDPPLVAAGQVLLGEGIKTWGNPSELDQFLHQSHALLNETGDHVYGVTNHGLTRLWVLQNDWSGFPDPSEFILVGFNEQSQVIALCYFEDWPNGWSWSAGNERADKD